MKLEQTSYSVDNVIQLKESVNEYLKQPCNEERTTVLNEKVQGGILSDIRYSWLAKGPKLEVLHTKSGAKVAAWCFRAQHDFDTGVTCVADLANAHGRAPLLVVGLECEITGGMVCVFDVGSSRVIRAIQIDDKVTAVAVVSGGCDNSLPGVLRALDGVIAVGTAKGKVFLVDLCRQLCEDAISNVDNDSIRDEINSCHLIHLSFQDLRNLERYKEISLNKGDHLCLQLNERSTSDIHFSLFTPTGELRLRANMSEVIISCLQFSPVLGSLLVGFNFGAWQLYNLVSSPCLALEYTSPMYEDCIPVGHFAVQEPCDDPRAFCYVWVAFSIQDVGDAGSSLCVMYALAYQAKEYLEGYGMLYQELTGTSIRFQVDLTKAVTGSASVGNDKCLALRSYTRPITTDSPDERLALCTLVWSHWDAATAASTTYLTLFDLNQWYKEQMPGEARYPLDHNERYLTCVSLTDLMANSSVHAGGLHAFDVLDLRVDPQSVSPFICPQRLEEHYYPSALALRLVCATERQLVWMHSEGTQRHLLAQLELAGPLCLLQPAELYHRCVALGLCPAHQDMLANPTPAQQRAHVMSVALEQQLVRWLCRCARDWANGSQGSAGCTLDSLLEWAWQRANTLKFNADKLCVPLFDHSGVRLDHNALLQLNHAACQLNHLTTLFDCVVHHCDMFFTQQDLEDIRYQWHSLQMISIYLEVLQWLLNVGLLPECPLSMYPRPDESERISAPYPVDSLARFYAQRRQELQDSEALLFIDQLVARECGGSTLSKQWQCDGGSGVYPPPSLQALLRTYLVEDIEIEHKHCLFIYMFLDLAMTLDQSRYKSIITHLIKFPAVFKLSPSIIKMTQAFWQLDHGDFSTAMAQLLDPAVASEDLKPWHHRTVLKALLLQGQHQHALLYQQVRKPPVSSVQDICIVITLLIVNDLLQEAFHFQRQNRSVYNEKEILKHFFSVSDKMNHLASILQLPLSTTEEAAFISYLESHPGETNQNLRVIFYLQRDRYAEAFEINDKMNQASNEVVKQGLLGQQDRNFRNVIVSGFKKTLPEVTQTLLDYMKKQKIQENLWGTVEVLVPMSVFVHETKNEARYKSTLIQASFQKAKETWGRQLQEKDTPFISTPKIAVPSDTRHETPLIYANVMQPDLSTDTLDPDMEATPSKRMRLSPRQPISSTSRSYLQRSYQRMSTTSAAAESPSLTLLDTPIVKRKSYREQAGTRGYSPVGTPTSILKVRSFIRKSLSPDIRDTSTTPELLEEDDQPSEPTIPTTPIPTSLPQRRRSPLGVSPRRPIQRTPRPAVHFEEARPSSRSSDSSTTDAFPVSKQHLEVHIDVHREQTPDVVPASSKDSSEDVFYSPDASLSDKSTNITVETMEVEEADSRASLKRKAPGSAVKPRRSYKTTPSKPTEPSPKIVVTPAASKPEVAPPRKSELVPKLGARRSLTRQVLEHNTLAKALQQSKPNLSIDQYTVGVEVSYSKTVTSMVKTTSDLSTEETCDKSTVETKNVFTTEKDPETSTQVIKHVHNESSSKSSLKKVTEIVDEDRRKSDYHVLSFSSDIDDSMVQNSSETNEQQNDSDASVFKEEQNTNETEQNKDDTTEMSVYVSMEDENESAEISKNKKANLTETVFEDISSIVEDEEMDETIDEQQSEASSVDQSEDSNENVVVEAEIHEPASKDASVEEEEEPEQVLVPSSEEEQSSDEERISNQDEEEQEEEEQQSEATSGENSSHSSDVIEIKSSSEESTEELKINRSDETEENVEEEEENILEEIVETELYESEEAVENIEDMEQEIEDDIDHDIEVEAIVEEIDEEIELPEDIRLEIEECIQEEEATKREAEVTNKEETTNRDEEKTNREEETANREEEATDMEEEEEPLKLTLETSDENVPQDCLETMSFTKSQEEINQTDFLCAKDLSKDIQKIDVDNVETYTPSRRSKRISSKQEPKKEEETVLKTPSRSTRRRSTSVDVEEPKLVQRTSTRRRSASVDVEAESSDKIEVPKLVQRPSTRRRSASVDVEAESCAKIEEPKLVQRASTRRRSASVDVEAESSDKIEVPKLVQRASTRRRSASVDVEAESSDKLEEPKSVQRASTRRRSASVDIEAESSIKIEEPKSVQRASTRRRSASVDMEVEDQPKPRRRTRSTSVEAEEAPRRSTRASSVVNLPPIEEETRPTRRTTRASSVESTTSQKSKQASSPARRGRKRSIQSDVISEENEVEQAKKAALEAIPEKIEEYSATHRMTRRQKMIMEKSLELQEMKKLEKEEEKPRVDHIDPIKLLDKESFTGSPDLEEHHHRSTSPASSIGTASSTATHLTPESGTPKAGRRSSRRTSQGATPGTPRRSSRTASTADDASSVRSVPVAVVQLERMDVARHRSLSPTALLAESGASSPRSKRKSTRKSILPSQTDLSKISEENTDHPAHASSEELTAEKDSRPKRVGRPRKASKSESEEPQSSQSPESQESKASSNRHRRTTSYKPLGECVPKYSAYKIRKSFKVKKPTRNSSSQ